MPSLVRQKYWRLVHKGAWERSKKNFQWLSPLLFAAGVFVVTGLFTGFEEALKNVKPRLFIGGTTVIFAVVGYAYNLFRSAADIYVEQLTAVARIEKVKDTDVADAKAKNVEERAVLKTEIHALQRQLEGKQKDQALADKLTRLRRYGISDLLNRVPPINANDDQIAEWRHREDQWRQEVMSTMHEHGCSEQDLHKVEMIGTFPLLQLHSTRKVSKDLSMLTVRLDRIQEIIDKYAE